LLAWAYETAVAKGMPQAAMMKTKADQAVAAVEALRAQAEGRPAPPVPVAAAPVAAPAQVSAAPVAAPAAAGGASKAEIAEAEKQAKLLTWAYETAVAKRMPEAATAKARADQAVAKLQELKDGADAASSVPVAAAPVAAPAPVKAAPSAAAAVAGGTSKAQIAEAQKQAKLLTWAYKTAVAKGMPQAAMMKSKADQAVAALEAMKVGSKQTAMR